MKNIHPAYDPAIPLLGIYQRKNVTYPHSKTCTNIHSSFICNSKTRQKPTAHQQVKGQATHGIPMEYHATTKMGEQQHG